MGYNCRLVSRPVSRCALGPPNGRPRASRGAAPSVHSSMLAVSTCRRSMAVPAAVVLTPVVVRFGRRVCEALMAENAQM